MAMDGNQGSASNGTQARQGRLETRVRPPTVADTETGTLPLGKASGGLLYVPAGYRADQPAPLVVMLHGAGGDAQQSISILRKAADARGLLLVAPKSRGSTWDIILGDYGPDVAALDQALAWVFERYAVDPERVAIGGFSDGASYALSLGLTNGDLFKHVLAFSPGFAAPASQQGTPRLFVSHGNRDAVLSIDACSRRLVPRLQRAGYEVLYREFDGPHTVPGDITREAVEWFAPAPK
ncbi:MAG TPA: alpha/beta hydrolase-fold protein [Myxococcaceae bacterium]|jgi:predicted esterase